MLIPEEMANVAEPPAAGNRTKKTLGNAATAGFFHISSTFAWLAATPILLGHLGLQSYGFWALVNATSKYGGVADFGIGSSLVRHVAEFHTQGDDERVRQTITIGVLFYSALLAMVVPVAIFIAPKIVGLGHLQGARLRAEAPILLTVYIINFFVLLFANGFGAMLNGFGRLRVTARVQATSVVVMVAASVVAMFANLGLLGLAYALAIQGCVTIVLAFFEVKRFYGRLLISPQHFDGATTKRILSNGGWIQLSSLMVMLYAETDQLVVAAFLGLEVSALFDVGSKLARAVRALSFYFNSAFLPSVASYDAERGRVATLRLFGDGTRYLSVVTFFTAGMLFVGAPAVVTAWIGPHATNATVVFVVHVLVFVYLIDNMLAVAITMLRGMGIPRLETAYSVVNATVNIVATIALVRPLGLTGILVGTFAGTAVGATTFFIAFSRTLSVELTSVWRSTLQLTTTFVMALAAVGFVQRTFFSPLRHSRGGAFIEVLLDVLLYTVAFCIAVRCSRTLAIADRTFLERALPARLRRVFDTPLVRTIFVQRRTT